MARLGHAPWDFNCSRTRLTHVPLYKEHKLFLETRTILQRINCFSCTYLTAHPMPYIFLCLTFSCALHALHFLVPYIFLCLTFSCALHFLVPYIFLCLTFSCALHFLVPYIFLCLTFSHALHFLVPYIFLCLTFPCTLHFLMPCISLYLTFSYALHFLVPCIFLCLTFSYALHFFKAQRGHVCDLLSISFGFRFFSFYSVCFSIFF